MLEEGGAVGVGGMLPWGVCGTILRGGMRAERGGIHAPGWWGQKNRTNGACGEGGEWGLEAPRRGLWTYEGGKGYPRRREGC